MAQTPEVPHPLPASPGSEGGANIPPVCDTKSPCPGTGARGFRGKGAGIKFALALLIFLFAALPALAQDAPGSDMPEGVTFDEVNEIAEKMYCPVCEMEPLDTCGAVTCVRWKEEIAEQLADGLTEDQIIANFVERYGDRVVGVPQNTGLRLLSLFGPLLAIVAASGVGWVTFRRWQSNRDDAPSESPVDDDTPPEDDPYRSRLEQDLNG